MKLPLQYNYIIIFNQFRLAIPLNHIEFTVNINQL